MKLIITLSLLLLVAANCKKKEVEATLSGRLLTTCNGQPVSQATITFRNVKGSGASGNTITKAVTDEDGNFSITYKYGPAKMRMYINGDLYMGGLMAQENVNFGNLYLSPVMKAVVRIKVLNPPANNTIDTLFCWPYGGGYSFRCYQPIHDTVFPIGYFSNLEVMHHQNKGKVEMEFGWQYGNLIATRVYQLLSPCTQVPDTFDIIVQ